MIQGLLVCTCDGPLILVNREYACRTTEPPRLVSLPGGIPLERVAAGQLERLMARIRGWDAIVPVSGWRSYAEQQQIWDDTLRQSGRAFTEKFVALPGHSEHQTGLAIDLGRKQEQVDFICPEFPYDGVCGEFRALAAEYGFVERYPAGKEAITGIGCEPWHFRYVGVPHALLMCRQGMVLEEYLPWLRQFGADTPLRVCCGGKEYAVWWQQSAADVRGAAISGDNAGGFVVTAEGGSDAKNA